MLSGVIPAMIYYGVDIMHPSYFLVASVVLCAIVSLATGSSWSTIATVGVAIVGVGNAFGLHQGLVAGAVISGAYFGDKMSPALRHDKPGSYNCRNGSFHSYPLHGIHHFPNFNSHVDHIRNHRPISIKYRYCHRYRLYKKGLESSFHITPWLLSVPVLLIIIIIKKVPPIPAMLGGVVLGVIFRPHFST